MLKKNEYKRAFTLIETTIVLILSVLILGISLLIINSLSNHQMEEQSFWHSFELKFNQLEYQTKTSNQPSMIIFGTNEVQFRIGRKNDFLQLPHGLYFVRKNRSPALAIEIHDDGFIDPQTVVWHSKNSKHDILQKFQLGCGVYNLYQK